MRQGSLIALSYDDQLRIIEAKVKTCPAADVHAWLSIAESIKTAKRHALDCPKAGLGERRKKV